jgi:hypothetical protein
MSTTTLAIDVRTSRIVFFTQAPADTIPVDSVNWVATYLGNLPAGLALDNCYQYRYLSGQIVHAAPAPKPAGAKPTLESNNRKALTKALTQRLLAQWTKVQPWREELQDPRRAAIFAATENSFAQRIADAVSPEEFSGLAREIDILEVQ